MVADASLLSFARWLVHERGFSVIPLDHPGETTQADPTRIGKVPVSSWKPFQSTRATDDNLQAWFGNGRCYNIGIVTGGISGVVAVDCDSPEAIAWVDGHLPPTAMITRTGKGEHRFYRHPGGVVRNTVRVRTNDPRVKIDIRADGGYVVAPGSVHTSGVVYECVGEWPRVGDLPVFDRAWLEPDKPNDPEGAPRQGPARERAGRRDHEHVVQRARAYLLKVPPAIEGQGGDAQTFKACCGLVRGFDLADAEALELLRDWNQRCVPPWSEAELIEKINGARKYGEEAIGGRVRLQAPYERTTPPPVKSDETFAATERDVLRSRPTSPPIAVTPGELGAASGVGVTLEDFHAYMPMHAYIFAPTRDVWPAASVNCRIRPVGLTDQDGKPVVCENGQPKTLKASAWLDRHQPVEQLTWAPGRPMIIHDWLVSDGGWIPRARCKCFNLYRPAQIVRGAPSEAGRWIDHVRRVYPDTAAHIVSWLAHRVQRPHEKINHALVLGGLQGIGKDTLLEPVKLAVGPWNFVEVSPRHLLGRFNGFVKSVILRVNEARDLGDVDRYSFYDHMKIYTASPPDVLRVDEKNLREYVIENVCGASSRRTTRQMDSISLPTTADTTLPGRR